MISNQENISLRILSAKQFLTGQLALFKIEFVNTEDNKYLEVMNEINKTLTLIDYLEKNSIELGKQNRKLKEKIK